MLDLAEHRRRAEHRDRWRHQRAAAELLPGERVSHCQKSLAHLALGVDQLDGGRCEFAGVLTCDSRWHCPLCAAKLTERSRRELQRAITLWTVDGGAVYLATFTFPHDATMRLRDSLDKMQAAQKWLKGQRGYKAAMKAAGAIGSVKALEVTLGERNGWHPHVHALIFARSGAEEVLGELRGIWARAVERVGLGRVNEHGFDLRGGDYAAEYVAKFGKEPSTATRDQVGQHWGASHELTKGHTKSRGERLKGATPFALLRRYLAGDEAAGDFFREYARAFKGKAQLYWSPRLRGKIDLLELQSPPEPAPVRERVLDLDRDDWRAILRHNARWEVLYVCERYGPRAAGRLVMDLRAHRGRWSDAFDYDLMPHGPPDRTEAENARAWRELQEEDVLARRMAA